MKHYVYKITFEEDPHIYYGVRSHSDPEKDLYLGSPKTHKIYWEIYTPKKTILSIYLTREEAAKVENELICQNMKYKFCLNEHSSFSFSPEICKFAGKLGGEITGKKIREDEIFSKNRSQRISKSLKYRYSQNKELLESKRKHCRQISHIGLAETLRRRKENSDYKNSIYRKISQTKSRRFIEDVRYKENLLCRAKMARYIYNKKIQDDKIFANRVQKNKEKFIYSAKNTIWINDGKISKRLNNLSPIPQGFTRGRLPKIQKL